MKMKTRNGRCLCGLRIDLHFDDRNHKLSCEVARILHPTAKLKRNSLLRTLFNSGASLQKGSL